MFESLLLLAMFLDRPTPAQADALILAYVSTPQELPAELPEELRPALLRFLAKEQLWQWAVTNPLKSEIEWTRRHWPNDLPNLEDIDRLPTETEARDVCAKLAIMRANLEQAAEFLPLHKEQIWARRGELDACQCFYDLVLQCRSANNYPVYRRQSLAEIRATLGDRAYFSGDWPVYPWWQIPLTP